MARPLYEDRLNLQDEEYVAGILQDKWGCALHKLPISYGLDYAATRGQHLLKFWLEIKRRNRTWHQYDDIFLSLQKVDAANRWHAASLCPAFFIVLLNDALVYTQIIQGWPTGLRGRTDRGDWQDIEPVQMIPTKAFMELSSPPPA
jgi:hypothetical protein